MSRLTTRVMKWRPDTFLLWLALLLLPGLVAVGWAVDKTTIQLWHPMPAPSRAVLTELVKEYETRHPDITVHLLYKENEEVRMAYMSATAFTEGGPDLLYGPSDFTGALVEMKIVKPLEDLFTPEELAEFDPKGLTWYQGHLYQIGDELGNHLALVYNKRLFAAAGLDRPPQTLQEMVAFGRKLTVDKDGDGIVDQYGLVWNFTEVVLSSFFLRVQEPFTTPLPSPFTGSQVILPLSLSAKYLHAYTDWMACLSTPTFSISQR